LNSKFKFEKKELWSSPGFVDTCYRALIPSHREVDGIGLALTPGALGLVRVLPFESLLPQPISQKMPNIRGAASR
jgi:hypothetical protein